jgi:hypothetical protein
VRKCYVFQVENEIHIMLQHCSITPLFVANNSIKLERKVTIILTEQVSREFQSYKKDELCYTTREKTRECITTMKLL